MSSAASNNNFGSSSTADQVARDVRLDGKVIIITGANAGIGEETARTLAKHGAHVILACRNRAKTEPVLESIRQSSGGGNNLNVEFMELDLSSLESVRKFAADFIARNLPLYCLVCNAGIVGAQRAKSQDGFELQIATNHLGHFALVNLLLDRLKEGAPSRIVVVSSMVHQSGHIDFEDFHWEKRSYSKWKVYAQSKLANLLFVKELDRRLKANNISNVTVNALHPGVVNTQALKSQMGSFIMWLGSPFLKSPQQGAATSVYLVTAPEVASISGRYFVDCKEAAPAPRAEDMETALKLWELSVKLTGVSTL